MTVLEGNVLELKGGKDSCCAGLWGIAVKRKRELAKNISVRLPWVLVKAACKKG